MRTDNGGLPTGASVEAWVPPLRADPLPLVPASLFLPLAFLLSTTQSRRGAGGPGLSAAQLLAMMRAG